MSTNRLGSSDKLHQLFADVLEIDPSSVTPESSPETIDEWDSFAHMRLVMAIENEFNLTMTMEQVLSIESFSDLRKIVEAH
jgi:acyl carrier protein